MKAPRFDYDAWLWAQADAASQSWFAAKCRDPYTSLYLYYRRGALTVARDKPDSTWELGNGARLGCGITREVVRNSVYEVARRLPCLPTPEQEPVLIAGGFTK